jgi:hypothetical protein
MRANTNHIRDDRDSEVLRHIAQRIFVIILAITFAILGCADTGFAYLRSLVKTIVITTFMYAIMFIFHQRGGRKIAETFFIALSILSCGYFAIAASWTFFFWSVGFAALIAVCFQFFY